ncbi:MULTISPECIES: hypothetical protein [Parabacteroides]|uniref:hypothetical protein n=1 Tax=Parabacteroides TaxID=375288 RepID=UPI00257F00B3|nr:MULTISPECIES: hypothetical protein [Parabacteroides]
MADNIDKALNGLGLKTDSLPNDWMVTIVNPKSGEPAENMTVARFSELLAGKMMSLLGINELRRGMNFVSKIVDYKGSYIIGRVYGLCVIKHGWSNSTPAVLLVDPYQKTIEQIAGISYDRIPASFEFVGDESVKDLKITNNYDGNSGNATVFNIAYQDLY